MPLSIKLIIYGFIFFIATGSIACSESNMSDKTRRTVYAVFVASFISMVLGVTMAITGQ